MSGADVAYALNVVQGDSGGPLVTEVDGHYTLIGLVSFGSQNCDDGSPAAFTKVKDYLSFLCEEASVCSGCRQDTMELIALYISSMTQRRSCFHLHTGFCHTQRSKCS